MNTRRGARLPRMRLLLAVLLTSCLDQPPTQTCEEEACAYVPACSPMTSGGWDMRNEPACLGTFACGSTPADCLDALLALPCLSTPPTNAELDANTRALKLAHAACL